MSYLPVIAMKPRPRSRILLVDSDISLCSSLSRTLTAFGYGLDVAYDGDQARGLAGRQRYSVALVGERLTDGDGVTLFGDLCRLQHEIVGVLVATVANLQTVVRAVTAGMARVCPVPVDSRDLLDFIAGTQAGATAAHRDAGEATHACGLHPEPADSPSLRILKTERAIAALTLHDIAHRLTTRELIEIIRSVEYPFAGKERLEHFDRDTLERVVHLIRRWCINRQRGEKVTG